MSPVKSKAQLRRLGELVSQGKMTKSKMLEFIKATPNVKDLPERVGKDKVRKVKKI